MVRIRTEYEGWQEIFLVTLPSPPVHTSIFEIPSLEIYKCTIYGTNSGMIELFHISEIPGSDISLQLELMGLILEIPSTNIQAHQRKEFEDTDLFLYNA